MWSLCLLLFYDKFAMIIAPRHIDEIDSSFNLMNFAWHAVAIYHVPPYLSEEYSWWCRFVDCSFPNSWSLSVANIKLGSVLLETAFSNRLFPGKVYVRFSFTCTWIFLNKIVAYFATAATWTLWGYSLTRGPGQLSRYSDWLRAGRSRDRISLGARFSAPVRTGPGAPSLLYIGYWVFPGG